MAGEISFDAAHIICRAADQITDGPTAEAAEEQMLAFARSRPLPESDGPRSGPVRDDSGQATDDGPGTAGPDGEPGSDPGGPATGPTPPWTSPGLDPTQLRRVGEEILYRTDPEAAEERERKRFERRHLSFGFTLENTGTITGACGDTLSLEIIKTAVHAFGPPLGAEDTRTAAQRRMDGLTAACQAALDSGGAGTRHGAAPHLSILVEEQTLAGGSGAAGTAGAPAAGPTASPATGAGSWGRTCSCSIATSGSNGSAPGTSQGSESGTTGAGSPTANPSASRSSCPPGANAADAPVNPSTAAGASGPPGYGPRAEGTSGLAGTPPGYGPPADGASSLAGAPPGYGPPPARTGYGAMLTARQVLALACRADLSVIRWRGGIPLDVGRRYRTETPAIRRALEARDQGCRFTGCGMPAVWSTAHHLKPWSEGGVTSLKDTALFCFVHHHVYIHLFGWTVSGDPNGTLRFTHPNGYLTLDSPLPSQTNLAP